ncbi:hypothetical protein [Methylomonas koyamae]|uniref:hypothetical protein n=1 Tax=Methylomonas koyamae TaxID=702114 RepID=UPI00211069BF|nr:hypothetical protein [Methylomonas koyamae]
MYRSLHGEPPPAYLLGIGGLSFELGAALSPAAQTNLAATTRFARALLQGTPAAIAASAAASARMPD